MLLVALLCAWTASFAASTQPPKQYSFNIPRGSLVAAIRQFSEQTGIQVTANFGDPEMQDQPVEQLLGDFNAEDALLHILSNTDLHAQWQGDGTVHVFPRELPRAMDGVNEITVTGSRLTWGGDGPEPVRVYDRADIDRYGVSSLPGLAGYLTQQPYSFGEWAQQTGAQHFQMRGLGVDTTLVLINGRRAPPSATSVTLNAFDLNTIPLTAVDRIEIMSDSASAIYGADAIGGVVNIILKETVTSPDVYLHYGDAAGGARERRAATSFGSSSERFKSAFTVDYFERGMLVGAERDLWRNQDFTRFGGTDWRVPTANPGNVYSITGDPLPGLSDSQASIPVGSTGIDLMPQDFVATQGVVNRDSSLPTVSILPDLNRVSGFGSAEYSLGEHSSIFGEVLLASSDVVAQGPLPFVTQQVVPEDNPYNPFGEPVAVDYRLLGMKPIAYVTEAELARLVFGARGGLHRWNWEIVVTGSDERVATATINEVDVTRVQSALESTEPETALNLFRDGPAGSEALLSSLVRDPQLVDSESTALQLAGFLRGHGFRAPGGMSEFVLGGELRREEITLIDSLFPVQQARDIASGFAEVKLPLWKGLSVKLALRGDYYENTDDSVNPQYGLVWRPASDWLLRAAYGTSFRPPSVLELFSERADFILPVADPRRGGSVSLVTWTVGGNPALENVSARSFTSGLVYRPSALPGMHLGAHYWRVVMDNRVVVPRISDVEKLEQLGRVTRQGSSGIAGWPGGIVSVDASLLNFGKLDTAGVDLDLSYRFTSKFGGLQIALTGTWTDRYASQDLNPVERSDRVGVASLDGTIPEWQLLGTLAWAGTAWGASTTATFTPSYWDADVTGILNRRLPSRTIVDLQAWIELGMLFESDLLHGFKVTAGALNLFDEKADFANVGLGLGFDVSQAELRQRFAYLRLVKEF